MAKKFRSSNGKDIRIALTSGEVAIVGKSWRELPESLWGPAYAQGAISDDMKVPSVENYIKEKQDEQKVKDEQERMEVKNILRSLYDSPKDILGPNGQLLHRKVIQFVGRPLKREYIDPIWDEVVAENNKE